MTTPEHSLVSDDQIVELVNLITELDAANALDLVFPEVRAKLEPMFAPLQATIEKLIADRASLENEAAMLKQALAGRGSSGTWDLMRRSGLTGKDIDQ